MSVIVLLAYENEIDCLLQVADSLRNSGHSVTILEGAVATATKHSSSSINNKYIGIKSALDIFEQKKRDNLLSPNPWSELYSLERSLLDGSNTCFRRLMRTAPQYYPDHHTRKPYYRIHNDYDRCSYILALSHWFIDNIQQLKPDLVFCLQGNNFIKQLAAASEQSLGYKFFILSLGRISNSMILLSSSLQPVVLPINSTLSINNNATKSYIENSSTYKGLFHSFRSSRSKSNRFLNVLSSFTGLVADLTLTSKNTLISFIKSIMFVRKN